jgi:hypothetical protein
MNGAKPADTYSPSVYPFYVDLDDADWLPGVRIVTKDTRRIGITPAGHEVRAAVDENGHIVGVEVI